MKPSSNNLVLPRAPSDFPPALIGNPLKKLTQQQKQEIANTVEPDPTRRIKILKNTRLLCRTVELFVQKECPRQTCGFMHSALA